ncbi:unnamed protein product, partial [Prunus brigantina]
MNRCCRSFFWGKEGTPLVAWKDVCMPKDQGGLGFLIRDCDGHVLLASANNIGENSINVVGSVALRDGLVAAIERGWDQIIIEEYILDLPIMLWQEPHSWRPSRIGRSWGTSCPLKVFGSLACCY